MLSDAYTALWLLFFTVWLLAAFSGKRTIQREAPTSRILYSVPVMLGFYLVFRPSHIVALDRTFVPDTQINAISGLAMTAAGIALAFWARFNLGRNWSGTVTVKEDHRLIQSGPYRFVRHPIYSGLLLAMAGTAIGAGRLSSLIGVAIAFLGFRSKWRIEERFMQEQFGARYVQYKRDVKAVIPGLL